MLTKITMKNGLIIRQDFRECVRFLMFETDYEEWRYATHGGTAFVVSYQERVYGLTSRHALKDFNWCQLALTDEKFGKAIAGLKSVYYPSKPTGGAVDTDVLDIALIEFSEDIVPAFFKGSCYILDPDTMGTSEAGDALQVNGVLKELSHIEDGELITPHYGLLDFTDIGAASSDPTLRQGEAQYEAPGFTTLEGLSGAPVFNVTRKQLCGMAVCGGLSKTGHALLHYIDMADIGQLVCAVAEGRSEARYNKQIVRLNEKPSS